MQIFQKLKSHAGIC